MKADGVRLRWLPCAMATLFAACQTGPVPVEGAIDPSKYRVCADPEGQAAWQRAQAAIVGRDDAAALADLRRCAERCPEFVPGHLAYQDAARRVGGDAQRSMQAFYLGDGLAGTVRQYLRARLSDTSYAQCNALEAILAKDPSFAWAHLSRARVTRRQGRLLQALDMFAQAIVYDPDMHEARLERAQVLAELGRDEEAAVDYRTYVQAEPDDLTAKHAYASLLLYRLGRVGEALALLDELDARQKGSSLRMDRAAALWRGDRPREAVEAYLAVLAEDPRDARAALNIGLLYYEVVPRDDAMREVFWPKARAAFRMFLEHTEPTDGHEQFERALAVPYRLGLIGKRLGAGPPAPPTLDDLRWPAGA